MSLKSTRFQTQEEMVFSFESRGSQIIILQVREEEVLNSFHSKEHPFFYSVPLYSVII